MNNNHCRILQIFGAKPKPVRLVGPRPDGRTQSIFVWKTDLLRQQNAVVYETTETVAWKVVYIFSLTVKRTKQKQKDD